MNFEKLLDPRFCFCRCSEWLLYWDRRNSYGIFRVCELHTKIKSNNFALNLDSKFWCFHIYIFQMKSHCRRKELFILMKPNPEKIFIKIAKSITYNHWHQNQHTQQMLISKQSKVANIDREIITYKCQYQNKHDFQKIH